jgi:hypothetical protein
VVLTALLPIILLLQLPISDVLWTYAPHLRFLQFPWRWLLALSLVACVLAAMALKRPPVLVAVLIIALAAGGGMLFFQPCDDEDAVSAQLTAFRGGQGTEGTDEYTPVGADNSSVQQHLPLVRVLRGAQDDTADSTLGDNPEWRSGGAGSISAKADAERPNGEHWLVHVVTPERSYAVLRLMDYPSWRVTVDGEPALRRPVREDGLMAVPLIAGSHKIEVRWFATRDVIAGRGISAIALLGFVLVAMLERRERRV